MDYKIGSTAEIKVRALRDHVKFKPGNEIKCQGLNGEKVTYRFLAHVGDGGNGRVFKMLTKDGPNAGLIVAVKFLELSQEEIRKTRFESEIAALKSLSHPNIVKLYGEDKYKLTGDREVPFYVMEYLPKSIASAIRAGMGINPDLLVPVCMQIASALKCLHSSNIIHRDIKPDNILLDGTSIKLADFGIMKELDSSAGTTEREKNLKLQFVRAPNKDAEEPSVRVAPKKYMSPEQWEHMMGKSTKVEQPSDWYQFGLLIYELVSGYNFNAVCMWRHNGEWWDKNAKTTSKACVQNSWKYEGSVRPSLVVLAEDLTKRKPQDRPNAEEVHKRLSDIFDEYYNNYVKLYGTAPHQNF